MANSYLDRTLGTPTNQYKYTISAWVKRSALGSNQTIFGVGDDGQNNAMLKFTSDDQIQIYDHISNTDKMNYKTNRKFRDTSGWYHIVVSSDRTLGSPSTQIWVNGVQETSFASSNEYSQNDPGKFNTAVPHYVGAYTVGQQIYDGYISHFVFVDGSVVAPTAFGETDATSGIWKFKAPSGVTFGNNGIHLKFENSGNLGLDSSGNTNNMNTNGNLKQALDTPSNVYAVFNPLDNYYGGSTFENANTTVYTSSSAYGINKTNIGVDSGKWYWEVKIGSNDGSGNNWYAVGISGQEITGTNQELGKYNYQIGYYGDDGSIRKNSTNLSTGTTFTTNDIIGVAMDLNNNKIYFHKNGTYINTVSGYQGNPTTGQNGFDITANPPDGFYFPCVGDWDNNNRFYFHANFGNGYFATTAVSSNSGAGEQDDGGEGIFEYDVPAGYRALNTKNINTYG